MDFLSGWSGTWADFLAVDRVIFLQKLAAFHDNLAWTGSLESTQREAWEIEYGLLQETLKHVCQNAQFDPEAAWISFEQELIGEGGKRAADVNLILPTSDLFVVEFKHKLMASEQEIWRARFDLATMQKFHSESMALKGHCFLVLTRAGARSFKDEHVISDLPANNMLPKLSNELCRALSKPRNQYQTHQWQFGQFYRQPSLMHGTVQVFFEESIPTLKTEAGNNIKDARAELVALYEQAKKNKERYVVVVHGRPGAGKTLLGVSVVADLIKSYGAETCKPVFLSGNRPLVNVLRYTLEYHGRRTGREQAIDGRELIEDLVNFKRTLKNGNRASGRDEKFVVFDEAQRAWERVNTGGGASETELHLLCKWLAKIEFGILVLLVGDGQAIHNNEMSLDKMLSELDHAISREGKLIRTIMPDLHAHHMKNIEVDCREVFNLKTPIRQAYTDDLDRWIEAVLDGDAQKAKEVTSNARFDYPLLLANSKQDADDYARDLQRILHEDNAKVDAFRMGWLQSSHGGKFIPEVASQKNGPIAQWYVEPPGSPNSCCQLSSACTEFSSQGLELSLALFNWGQDLQYREGSLATSETPSYRRQQDHYTFGSYRVLLSRGRNGLIVKCDDQQTLDFLVRCGMKECRGANAVTA